MLSVYTLWVTSTVCGNEKGIVDENSKKGWEKNEDWKSWCWRYEENSSLSLDENKFRLFLLLFSILPKNEKIFLNTLNRRCFEETGITYKNQQFTRKQSKLYWLLICVKMYFGSSWVMHKNDDEIFNFSYQFAVWISKIISGSLIEIHNKCLYLQSFDR